MMFLMYILYTPGVFCMYVFGCQVLLKGLLMLLLRTPLMHICVYDASVTKYLGGGEFLPFPCVVCLSLNRWLLGEMILS